MSDFSFNFYLIIIAFDNNINYILIIYFIYLFFQLIFAFSIRFLKSRAISVQVYHPIEYILEREL